MINSFKYIFGGSALLTSAVTTKLFSDTRRDLESVTLEKRVVVLRNILSLYLHIETGGENNDRFNAWKDGVIESATAILSGKRGLEISALPNSTVKYLKLIAIIEQNFPGLSFVDEQRSASTESRSLLTGQDSPGHFARGKTMKAIIPVNAVVKKK